MPPAGSFSVPYMGGSAPVRAIVPVTHGATAALVDDSGLVLPVLDYEFEMPAGEGAHYASQRPPYSATYSPQLPASFWKRLYVGPP